MIALTLDLGRVNKERIFVGKTGKRYLSFVLVDGPDQYGNAGQVLHSVSKEERLAGRRGEVVGSWRIVGANKTKSRAPAAPEDHIFDTPEQAYAAAKARRGGQS
jgi:hypothetical protein